MKSLAHWAKRWLRERDAFTRSVIWMGSGTAVSQGLIALSLLVLTRLYTPEALGSLAIFIAATTLASSFVTLRYDLAIPLPEDPPKSARLVILSGLCALLGSGLISVFIDFYPQPVARWLQMPEASFLIWLLPLSVMISALNQSFYFFALKQQQLRRIAVSRLALAAGTIVVQIGGFPFLANSALIVGVVVGQGVQLLALTRRLRFPWREWGGWSAIREVGIRYRRFPQFYLWSGLISGISLQTPLILLSHFFSAAATGYYALAYRVLNSPLSLLGQSIGHAYLNAALQERDRIAELTRRVYVKQLELIAPFGLLFCILGPEVTAVLFGDSWRSAGVMMQWMAPFILLSFIVNPLTELFTIYEKQFLSTVFQLLLLAQRFLSLTLTAWLSNDLTLTIAVFSVTSALAWAGLLVWAMRTTGNSISTVFIPLRRLGWWLGMGGLMVVIKYLPNPFMIGCATVAGLALLIGYFRAVALSATPSLQARSEAGYP